MSHPVARVLRALAVTSVAALVAVPAWSSAPTVAAAADPLKVGTFNVRCANCSVGSSKKLEKPWSARSSVVASQIRNAGLDVVGVQEASAGPLHGSAYGAYDGKPQFEHLLAQLGSSYAITEHDRYNCSNPMKTCSLSKRTKTGASGDVRIYYKPSRLELTDHGSLWLDNRSPRNGSARFMAWAKFTDRATGEKFIFATAHVEPGTSSGKVKTRVKQVKKSIAEINRVNTGKVAVVWASDLASSKLSHAGNKSYNALLDAGFTDPLDNCYLCKVPGKDAYADSMTNEQYFTLNDFKAAPESRSKYPLGAHLDYILIDKNGAKADVTSWKEIIALDSSGNFDGVIPSDHNLVTASVVLS